jgi:MFS family permease
MTRRQLKLGYFALEGMNAFATSLFFNYLFFYTQSRFGFGNLENLSLSALNGFIYMGAAWFGGRMAQRHGYHRALKFGVGLMAAMLVVGATMDTAVGLLVTFALWTFGVCFTWPTLEAMASEGEPPAALPRVIGIYNLVWASWTAVAYFLGGAILEQLGPRSLFYVPAGLHLAQLILLMVLERRPVEPPTTSARFLEFATPEAPAPRRSDERARLFLRLAWVANPFAYVAINTVIAVIPGLARQHHLSPMFAGFFCSIWLFARMAAFLGLWLWPGWHYRFRWLVAAYGLLIASFITLLLSPVFWPVLVAQVAFGGATGLLYYASLFYSMDAGEAKGEHGGIHEAAIGAGVFAGPAVGAAALHFFPSQPNAGAWAVTALLLVGLVAFLGLRVRAHG